MVAVYVTVVFGLSDLCVPLQDDLSVPLLEDNLDGSSGVLFPFYDPDTHMLYLAGKVGLLKQTERVFITFIHETLVSKTSLVFLRVTGISGTMRSAQKNHTSTT